MATSVAYARQEVGHGAPDGALDVPTPARPIAVPVDMAQFPNEDGVGRCAEQRTKDGRATTAGPKDGDDAGHSGGVDVHGDPPDREPAVEDDVDVG